MTTRFWHGFADMHVIKDTEVVIASGDGAVITDTNGRDYIDATAALWFCNAGYGRREIADAVAEQLAILPGYSSFGAYTTDATLRAAERLTALSPIPNSVVFLGSGGSDAIDTATKLARRYWDVVGQPNKTLLVSREHSYHGMHAMGTSLGGIPALRNGYGGEPFINEVVHVPALDVDAVARVFDQRRDEVAAFVGEPVIGAGGVIPPTETYWREISELCRRYDVLLIADEVITGFGRMGTWWATQRFGIQPDMITFAKGVTSGYMPLGGVLVNERIRAPFWDEPIAGAVFRHGYTYSGHSGAAAAALANLDIIEREGLVDRVARLEPILATAVRRLEGAPLVGEIRTVGLTAAVAIAPAVLEKEPATPDKVVAAALRHGVASRVLRAHAIHISPPFVITEDQIDRMVDGIGNALEDVAAVGVPA
ncbi:MAG: aspartate aminotransferase family protein [Chloroflexi bacterium]|nr:MAG: aspartate aminotransferase family protein [Chloroflexota bacterium]